MEEAGTSDKDQLQPRCPVCLDLLQDPLTLHCGHSFCMVCLNAHWDQEDQMRVYSCPKCKETFSQRPVPHRNLMLAQEVKKPKLQPASAAKCYAGATEVKCDSCTGTKDNSSNQHLSNDGVNKSDTDLKDRLEEICIISSYVAAGQIIFPSEPVTREDFLKYFRLLTLDPNTAHPHLVLSENNRVVTNSGSDQPYSDHSDRFNSFPQLLCEESVCGRCYWELDWSSVGYLAISVTYKDIRRKGMVSESWFGHNTNSWSLQCFPTLTFWHNNILTEISGPEPSRIGVYVDHSAGTLSFYEVSGTMTLIHRVHTTFTQPLYAGFGVFGTGSKVKIRESI